MDEIKVTRLRDLYFPKGNEHGELWEPYWEATSRVVTTYGRTPEEARQRCLDKLNESIE